MFSSVIYKLQFVLFNSAVPHSVSIGKGSRFAYGGIGCVIHARAKIGSNCVIGQGITIGGRSKHESVPTIEDNVFIGAGARILGPITVGSGSIIAPNSVVIDNVSPRSIYGGVPARELKSNINLNEYI
ncbi:serine O-acetyltransferase [Vibrio echinoideorum]|uniref:DapH/DapD/GlmU-related protein n=1 Tax=Vibrio echinoideorum TaxID=2100116 RepID=A0ABU9FT10_9VIBR